MADMHWEIYVNVTLHLLRYAIAAAVLLLLLLLGTALLHKSPEKQLLGLLQPEQGEAYPVYHRENVIGRSRLSDVVIHVSTVSRNHCVLTNTQEQWCIIDTGSKGGVYVNGEAVRQRALEDGDILSIGGLRLQWLPRPIECKTGSGKGRGHAWSCLLLLSILQGMLCVQFWLSGNERLQAVLTGFGGLALLQWLLFIGCMLAKREQFIMESCAMLLCTLGMAVISAVRPGECVKQLAAVGIGIAAYGLLMWVLRAFPQALKLRHGAAAVGMGFLIVTLLFGREYYGAKNWLVLGGISLQPSELTKLCFVFAGAAPVDRLLRKKSTVLFSVYTTALCGLLILMNDFGTALVFFCCFLVVAYLRSGSIGTLALALLALGFAGSIGLKIAPHALRRLENWRHIWDAPLGAGYQQTQALMALASGGLFGLGPGQGKLKGVFSADADIVFASLVEQWGLPVGLAAVFCVMLTGICALRSARRSNSSFYAIGASAAAALFLVQTSLNALGTLDILPLTGVTFPFLSNGGSSMVGAWCLLAFIDAEKMR